MSRRRLVGAIAVVCVFGFSGGARGAFLEGPGGGRAAGMGMAFTAVSDDASALFHNPCGMVQLYRPEISFLHSKPFGTLDQSNINRNALAAVYPFERLKFGVSWNNLIGPSYRENTGTINLAFRIRDVTPRLRPDLAVGVQFAALRRDFVMDELSERDPVFSQGTNKWVMGMGLSFLSRPDPDRLPNLQVGLSARNINEPIIGADASDRVPRDVALGASYEFPFLRVALDVADRDEQRDIRFGLEGWLFDGKRVGLRGGVNRHEMALGGTFVQPLGERAGLSFDYAFLIPAEVEDTAGSHVLSARLKF